MERERARANYTANLSPEPNNYHLPPKPPLLSLSRRVDDAEISIFDAERYFNDGDEDDALKKKNAAPNGVVTVDGSANPRDSPVDGSYGRSYFPNAAARSFRATPTASTEASWNSQTGLLPAHPPGSVAVSVVRDYSSFKGSSSSTSTSSFRGRRFFGRRCACYGKKAVEVEDKIRETSSPIRSQRSSNAGQGFPKPDGATETTKFRISATEPRPYSLPAADMGRRIANSGGGGGGGFSFPVLISPATAPPLAKELEEPARASLEVFRPSVDRLARILRKSTSAPIHVDVDDVACCDGASSDLFELESFSAPSSTAYRRRRHSLHELPKLAATVTAGAGARQFRRSLEELIAPSEFYAPSEASVEWSVTTAEGGFERTSAANFSSAASEGCGKVRSAQTEKERFGSATAPPARNEGGAVKKRGGDGGLLNCGCEKAVNVGPDPVRFVPDQQRL